MQQCWRWFLELNATRECSMGVSAISHREIQAYFDLYYIEYNPEEVQMLRMFDSVAVAYMNEQSAKDAKESDRKSQNKSRN
jgi:hypothetical protein